MNPTAMASPQMSSIMPPNQSCVPTAGLKFDSTPKIFWRPWKVNINPETIRRNA